MYNRGIADQPTFLTKGDYKQALLTLSYYRFRNPPIRLSRFKELSLEDQGSLWATLNEKKDKLIELISFVLMPNHFHILLKQLVDQGISTYLSRATNSYTRYFNIKRRRAGAIFKGAFKAVHIATTEKLIHVSRYVHINPSVSYVVREEDFLSYPWSSLPDYLSGKSDLVDVEPVLSNFSSPIEYKKFILDQVDYGKRLEEIKHLTLE